MTTMHITTGTRIIEVEGNNGQLADIISTMLTAKVYEKDWDGKMTEKSEHGITFSAFVRENSTANPAVDAAQKEAQQFKDYWLKGHTEIENLKKELAESKKKYDDLTAPITPQFGG